MNEMFLAIPSVKADQIVKNVKDLYKLKLKDIKIKSTKYRGITVLELSLTSWALMKSIRNLDAEVIPKEVALQLIMGCLGGKDTEVVLGNVSRVGHELQFEYFRQNISLILGGMNN